MRHWDQRAGLLGVGLGILMVIFSLRMDLGSWNHPGPGFMPLGSGILLIIFCMVYFIKFTWFIRDAEYGEKESPWPRKKWGRIIGVLGALFLYTFLLTALGYLLTTFLLMVYLFRVVEPRKWLATIIQAVLTVLLTYMVFEKWLMVQFPKGFLGI